MALKFDQRLNNEGIPQIGAGSAAGIIEILLMQPLDVVKTRLQLQPSPLWAESRTYTGFIDGLYKMHKYEGITSWWKGFVPCAISEICKRTLKFLTFDEFKKIIEGQSKDMPPGLIAGLAGMNTGIAEAIFINPFEVVKVMLQGDQTVGWQKLTAWETTMDIIKNDGIGPRGLYRGVTATILKYSLFNFTYFGTYFQLRSMIPEYENDLNEFAKKLLLGFSCGVLAVFASIPFDVVKSRMQLRPANPCLIKYKSAFASIFLISREHGVRGLYKGLAPKVIRVGIGSAILFLAYDNLYPIIKQNVR